MEKKNSKILIWLVMFITSAYLLSTVIKQYKSVFKYAENPLESNNDLKGNSGILSGIEIDLD